MKKILFLLPLMLCASLSFGGMSAIVTNVTTTAGTAEDSITVSFFVTDSIGNISQADSFMVGIFNPEGDSVFAARYIPAAAQIDSIDISGRIIYSWTEQISNIDASGRIGTYTGVVIAVDTLDGTSTDYLDAGAFFSFQLTDDEFSISLARTRFIAEFVGAGCDTTFQKLYPLGGGAPKDSVEIYCNDIGEASPTLLRTVIFFKTSGVVDSVVSYKR